MAWYDMHCHLLPGVDDGSRDIEESVSALKAEYDEGVRTILFTPHLSADSTQADIARISDAYELVSERLQGTDFGKEMHLYLGSEIMYTQSVADGLISGDLLTLSGGRYVLLEFFPSVSYSILYDALRAVQNAGFRPLLAHIERYACIHRDTDRIEELRELGVYLQMNAYSLIGSIWDREHIWNQQLIRDGRIDILGTDTHGMHYRVPVYQKSADWIIRHCDEKIAKAILTDNPEHILQDKII